MRRRGRGFDCLTGCAIGETLGMVLRAGVPLRSAIKVTLAADTISNTVMEILDDAVMVGVPGAMHAGLANWIFWPALAFPFAVAFVVTPPVNKWLMLSSGTGSGTPSYPGRRARPLAAVAPHPRGEEARAAPGGGERGHGRPGRSTSRSSGSTAGFGPG